MKCEKNAASYDLQAVSSKRRDVPHLLIATLLLTLILSSFCVSAQKENKAIKQGNEAYRKNDFATAEKNYEKALTEDNKNAIAEFNMANALQLSNAADKSANLYDEVIKNSSDAVMQSNAYYNKALAMLQQNKLNDAIDDFKQALRLQPADNDTRENLQKALQEKQQQQPQPQPKQNKKQQPQNQKQQKQQQMNQQMMEQKFKELEDQEKQLQKDLQKQKTNTPDNEKDW